MFTSEFNIKCKLKRYQCGYEIKENFIKQAKKNKIPHYRIGSHIRFPADIVEKFILKGIAE